MVASLCSALPPAVPKDIFEAAQRAPELTGPDAEALRRLYTFTAGHARCSVGEELGQKYNMERDNAQLVVSVTNHATLEQTWFNAARTRKPQTFQPSPMADPTEGGRRCDFCQWETYTAEDAWGRIELPHAVTGSNLFKYGEPAHGLVLFKHHDPLAFTAEQLSDFLAASAAWFAAAAAAHPDAAHPFFLWNCGPRAGASQYHGHGQLMLTRVPVPAQSRLDATARLHDAAHAHTSYYRDLLAAHAALGLARGVEVRGPDGSLHRAWLAAHCAPLKDMELLLLGSGLSCPALAAALHPGLRALIDGLGAQTFNVGALNVPLDGPHANGDADGDANGDTNGDANGGANGGAGGGSSGGASAAAAALCLPPPGRAWRPLVARLVSRGRAGAPASDFGCLEVVGGASIGHTDPYVLMRALDERLRAAGLRVLGPEAAPP